MKQIRSLVISAAVLLTLTSCGDSRDKLMKDQINYMEGMAETLEAVAEGDMSSEDAAKEFSKLKKDGDEFMERKKDLMKDITPEEGQALIKKYSKESGEVMLKYMSALEKVQKAGEMTAELRDAIENSK